MELVSPTPTLKSPSDRFIGDVYSRTLASPESPPYLAAALTRFLPGSRTNWHVHNNGQTLHILEGTAIVGTRDGKILRGRAGDTVSCAAGEEHWHGSLPDAFMEHIAIVVANASSAGTTWLEPVDDAQYKAACETH
ncbi:cupin domain-containing protein [Pseudarthrobacter sp. NPDC080039]|uniref:cupin domain-containing protein n=1 Tax=unclassified Pseudarthrobacter TaxID=2647000 RepID=UPI00344C83AD